MPAHLDTETPHTQQRPFYLGGGWRRVDEGGLSMRGLEGGGRAGAIPRWGEPSWRWKVWALSSKAGGQGASQLVSRSSATCVLLAGTPALCKGADSHLPAPPSGVCQVCPISGSCLNFLGSSPSFWPFWIFPSLLSTAQFFSEPLISVCCMHCLLSCHW